MVPVHLFQCNTGISSRDSHSQTTERCLDQHTERWSCSIVRVLCFQQHGGHVWKHCGCVDVTVLKVDGEYNVLQENTTVLPYRKAEILKMLYVRIWYGMV